MRVLVMHADSRGRCNLPMFAPKFDSRTQMRRAINSVHYDSRAIFMADRSRRLVQFLQRLANLEDE